MSLDLLYRHADLEVLVDWLTSAQVRANIGDLRAYDEDGKLLPRELRDIPGNVTSKIFQEGSVLDKTVDPPVVDPEAWIHLRLYGQAEIDDLVGQGNPDSDEDRWRFSRMVKQSEAGTDETKERGVTVQHKRGGQYKDMQVVRGSEMGPSGLLFHNFLGGDSY